MFLALHYYPSLHNWLDVQEQVAFKVKAPGMLLSVVVTVMSITCVTVTNS